MRIHKIRTLGALFILTALLLPANPLRAAMEQAQVLSVEAPDVFRARLRSAEPEESVEIRVLGIITPSLEDPEACKAQEALNLTRKLIHGQWVSMEPDPALEDQDEEGRLLRYIYVLPGPKDLGAELLEQGLARLVVGSRFRELDNYWHLQGEAQRLAVGIWDEICSPVQPEESAPPRLPAELKDDAQAKIQELEARNKADTEVPWQDSSVEDPCCLLCVDGKACGDNCIPEDRECHDPPGCACDAEEL